MDKLTEIHGDGNCHICGRPKREVHAPNSVCSYPHGMVPVKPIKDGKPEGFWAWDYPEEYLKD